MRLTPLLRRSDIVPSAASRALEYFAQLLDHGLTPSGVRQLSLWQGIESHDPLRVESALLAGADPSRGFTRSGRLLHPLGAAIDGRAMGGSDGLAVLHLLLGAGASPHVLLLDRRFLVLEPGEPCLLRALRLGDEPCWMALLDYGADPDVVDDIFQSRQGALVHRVAITARSYAQAESARGSRNADSGFRFLTEINRRSCLAESRLLQSVIQMDTSRHHEGQGGESRRKDGWL